jgi:hypothetical protein
MRAIIARRDAATRRRFRGQTRKLRLAGQLDCPLPAPRHGHVESDAPSRCVRQAPGRSGASRNSAKRASERAAGRAVGRPGNGRGWRRRGGRLDLQMTIPSGDPPAGVDESARPTCNERGATTTAAFARDLILDETTVNRLHSQDRRVPQACQGVDVREPGTDVPSRTVFRQKS